MKYPFYGAENCDIRPLDDSCPSIRDPRDLYDVLSGIWSRKTCAPRMRKDWSEENKTLGQCSITAFLVQDIFGGEVYGVPLPDGNYHCYNCVDGHVFDLTSEQFTERLHYGNDPLQSRETHFAKEEKYRRYLYLKKKLQEKQKS